MITADDEYEQLCEDWRNRDRITWGLLGVLVIIGGLLLAAIYGNSNIDDKAKTALLCAGFSFALLCSWMLLRNLYLQAVGRDLMNQIRKGGKQAQEVMEFAERVPIRRTNVRFCSMLGDTVITWSSCFLLLLCASAAGLFLYLQTDYCPWFFVGGFFISVVTTFGFTWTADAVSQSKHKHWKEKESQPPPSPKS